MSASRAKADNFAAGLADWTYMFDSRAAQLQKQALDALSDLRAWIWGRHGAMLPEDLASITREEAERYAAYLDWYSRVEEVLLALTASGVLPAPPALLAERTLSQPAAMQPAHVQPAHAQPAAAQPPQEWLATPPVALAELLAAPTVRAPSSYGCIERTTGWQRVISVLSNIDGSAAAGGFQAA